jgi:cell division GTPase FtsZ
MGERSIRNEKDAEPIKTVPDRTEEGKLIRAMQGLEGHDPRFGETGGQCSDTACLFREQCVADVPGGSDRKAWQIPGLAFGQSEPNVGEETGVRDQREGAIRYAWIGAGQCGGRLVKSFYDLGYKKVLALNTNSRDLGLLGIPRGQKLLMDIGRESTARDMRKGAKSVQQYKRDIFYLVRQTFGTQVDHIMVCFGAGGGTGGGSVLELIEIAKRYARHIGLKDPNKSVGVVMTLPAGSGIGSPRVAQNAHKVAAQLSQMAAAGKISPLIIVDNDKTKKLCPRMTIDSFWSGINWTFANLFSVFNRLSALSSHYNSFYASDYVSIMGCGGCLVMGRSKVDRLDDPFAISEAVKRSLERTLFAHGLDLSSAKAGGCVVVGGRELMANVRGLRDGVNYAFDIMAEMTGLATIYRGIYEDNRDSLRVYTIIGGLDSPTARLNELNSELYFQPCLVDAGAVPLQQRNEDIVPLAEYFLAKQADFYGRPQKILSLEARKLLLTYSWPGNVDELAKAMERAYELTSGGVIQPDALPFQIIFADSEPYPKCILPMLDHAKRRIVARALELTKQREATARLIGVDASRLDRLMGEPNIDAAKKDSES